MDHTISAPLFAGCMFLGMLLLVEIGRYIGIRRKTKESDGEKYEFGAVDGAIFGLFGLLLAFTFSGAASRFDAHRQLIAEEANDIRTAYLRVDLLPEAAQPAMRESFRKYVDSRLEVYRKLPDIAAAKEEIGKSKKLQGEIWREAVAASRQPDAHPNATLLLPALNQMIDITTTRMMAAQLHPPMIIYLLLFGLGLVSSLLVGTSIAGARRRSWIHIVGYAAIMVITVFIIVDLEYPRAGLIRADAYDQVLVEVRENMK